MAPCHGNIQPVGHNGLHLVELADEQSVSAYKEY